MSNVALKRSQVQDDSPTARGGEKYVFIVSHVFPYPPLGGHELRILNLMKWLRSEGYRVVLVLSQEIENQSSVERLSTLADHVHWLTPPWWTRLGRRLPGLRRVLWENTKRLINPLWDQFLRTAESEAYPPINSSAGELESKKAVSSPRLAELTSRLARKYHPVAVIAEYILLTDCLALLPPNVLKIIDTIDVFSLKENQVANFGIVEPWTCTREEEREYLLRGEVIIAIQNREATILKNLVPEREVITVGVDYDIPDSVPGRLADPNLITVVGSDNPKNVHGLRSFLAECWPEIKSAHPSAILNVIGRVGPLCQVTDPNVKYLPAVENLTEIYQRSRVAINPCAAGTGLKIKSVEALAHGRPLVAWPHGVDGLEYSGDAPYLKCESWKEFAAAVVRILKSDGDAQALSERALAYARVRFGPATVYAQLRTRLAEQRGVEESAVKAQQLAPASPTYPAESERIASI